ncbi:sugar ABC transporter permease [Clostridium sp. KNHs216]|jgi:ABC-type sugar transport systems, permease components|uniref:carbohydrate ABC transporter permease n=1 Tax=Clostridium sp. KNHs216 TaxID=1550235 RepID=UPI0005700740|nr:sugar ABC transporter permease [Clostridium sp. KNHs216]MBE6829366.1 sugar ABC transporter permease [Oscillospiraceae bacterium]TQI66820.1 sn-glycerol 3-phosphate transport system permease protein [Clostridium sp. KNHs216]
MKRPDTASAVFKRIEPYFYLVPCLMLVGLFVYWPLFHTLFLSLSKTNAMGDAVRFVGIENYRTVLFSKEFLNSCVVTGKFVLLTAIPSIALGLALALLTEKKKRGSSVFEMLFSMPVVIASASGAMIWKLMLSPSTGFVNFIFGQKQNWFTDKQFALFAVAALTVWLSVGINYIFFLTGLRNVPGSISQAADMDGAGPFQKFFRITLPMISPTLFLTFIMNIASFAQTFTQIMILTRGGPEQSTNVLVYSIYNNAFVNDRYAVACVQSIFLFLILLVVTLLQFRLEKRVVYDS